MKQESANCNYSQSYNLLYRAMCFSVMVFGPSVPQSPGVLMPGLHPQNSDIMVLGYLLGMGNFEISLGDFDMHSRLRTTTLDIKIISGYGPWICAPRWFLKTNYQNMKKCYWLTYISEKDSKIFKCITKFSILHSFNFLPSKGAKLIQ